MIRKEEGRMEKKKMKWLKYIAAAFLLAVLWFSGVPGEKVLAEGHFQKMSENERFVLYADPSSGEFYAEDKDTGSRWYSNPPDRGSDSIANDLLKNDMSSQLILKYVDMEAGNESSVNSYSGSVVPGGAVLSEMEQGFSMEYTFPEKGSRVRMEVRLMEDYLEVTIPAAEWLETAPNSFLAMSVLPYFGAGSGEEEGYLFVPDGSGALIYFNNGKQAYDDYKQTIYGSDLAREELVRGSVQQDVRMPVFGAQNGENGFLAVVTQGDALGTIYGRVSGTKTSYNNVYCEFSLRTSGVKNLGNGNLVTIYEENIVGTEGLTIRYYLLSEGDCDYNAMARAYREYLVEEQGMSSREPAEELALYLELYGAIRKSENLLGIPVTVTEALTDYTSALELLQKLKQEEVNHIVLKYTNANQDNVKGTYLTEYKPLAKLGSSRQLEELTSYCRENHIVFAPNADLLTFKKSSFLGIGKYLYGSREITGIPVSRYQYKLSTDRVDESKQESFLTSPVKLGEKTDAFVASLQKLSFDSVSLDTLGNRLYSDYYRAGAGRQEALAYMQEAAEKIAGQTEALLFSNANAYMLPYAGYVEDVPQQSSGFNITDEDIPFYQLAVNGLVSYATSAVNFSANPTTLVLRAIESGSALKYTWITGDPAELIHTDYMDLYGTDSDAWMESALESYRLVNEIYRKTEGTQLIRHRILDSGVRESTYANGVRVIVNYNEREVLVDGQYPVDPHSFLVIESPASGEGA